MPLQAEAEPGCIRWSVTTSSQVPQGTVLNDEPLRRNWEEVRIFPNWWESGRPDWVVRPEELRGVIVGEDLLADGRLVIGEATTGVLPESVRVELLDDAGRLAAEAVDAAGRRAIQLDGLEPGAYVLRITSNEGVPVALAAQPRHRT